MKESLFFLAAAVLLIEGILEYIVTLENSTLRIFGFSLILLGVFSALLGRH